MLHRPKMPKDQLLGYFFWAFRSFSARSQAPAWERTLWKLRFPKHELLTWRSCQALAELNSRRLKQSFGDGVPKLELGNEAAVSARSQAPAWGHTLWNLRFPKPELLTWRSCQALAELNSRRLKQSFGDGVPKLELGNEAAVSARSQAPAWERTLWKLRFPKPELLTWRSCQALAELNSRRSKQSFGDGVPKLQLGDEAAVSARFRSFPSSSLGTHTLEAPLPEA